jgi:hypothetical protein
MGLRRVQVMLTRLHISSFIGLTIAVWLVALWIQGMPVLSVSFIKPFGIVVGTISVVVTLFNKYAWAWPIFRGWYVNRPDMRGTWEVELRSSWINPETDEEIAPITAYAVVRQTLGNFSLRLMTQESRSILIAHSIEHEQDGLFKLAGIYRNEPRIELQGVRSEIHHGAFALEIHGSPVESLEGHYWTDRQTKGAIKLFNRKDQLYDTFEMAKSAQGRNGT